MRYQSKIRALEDRIDSVIMGKRKAIKTAIVTLLAKGHLLIEDVPGVGKTTLAFTLAKSINCTFQRIQFTSDLMPSDIIGVNIYNPDTKQFEFKGGPIFANIVLADEINRTNPKTQSALLEAMNERRVSVDRKTFILPEPFMVLATENPLEYQGTFPLPESQLDRFMAHLKIGYPEPEFEKKALMEKKELSDIEALGPVLEADEVLLMQSEVESVKVDKSIYDYILKIITSTRQDERIKLGASTRAAQFLLKGAKASAYYEGRDYVIPDDVRDIAPSVLGHRIILKSSATIPDSVKVIEDILRKTPVPV